MRLLKAEDSVERRGYAGGLATDSVVAVYGVWLVWEGRFSSVITFMNVSKKINDLDGAFRIVPRTLKHFI